MWPNWVFSLMWIVTALLSLFIAWELIKDVNSHLACWWIRRRAHREQQAWIARRKQYAREALR